MIFTIFRDFFWIFSDFIFDLKRLKINKKWQKAVYFRTGPRGCDVALRPTWQRHAGPRGAYAAYNYILYSYSLHIV